ncbi:MAG: hypothetical protein ACTHPD_08950, partial [Rhizomicrobium sp.]
TGDQVEPPRLYSRPQANFKSPHLNSRREYLIAGVEQPELRAPSASLLCRWHLSGHTLIDLFDALYNPNCF